MRTCIDCNTSIDHLHGNSTRCKECKQKHYVATYMHPDSLNAVRKRRRELGEKLRSFETRKAVEKELGIKQFKQTPHNDEV